MSTNNKTIKIKAGNARALAKKYNDLDEIIEHVESDDVVTPDEMWMVIKLIIKHLNKENNK